MTATSLFVCACSNASSDEGPSGTGQGGSASGSTVGTTSTSSGSPTSSATGGSFSTGGNVGTGGDTGSSGAAGTGGSTGTGGAASDGGSNGGAGGGTGGGSVSGVMRVYASGYGNTIGTFAFDPQTGSLTSRGAPITGVTAPSFLAWGSPAKNLYALSETDNGRIYAYSIDPLQGTLAAINNASSSGAGPAHLLVDPSNKWVLVANYDGGTAAVLPIQANGGVGAPVDTQTFPSATPPLPHQIVLDPNHQFAFVPLKGADAIAQFRFDAAAGKLLANTPARVATKSGANPRHIAFHPNSRFAYVINESNSTMVAYTYDASLGRLTELQTLSTRAAGASGSNSTAEVAIHPSGKWLYGSNRGDNNIVLFSIGDADGRMTFVNHTSTGGGPPRHFSIDPTGKFLLAANQMSNNLVVFRIGTDGKLTQAGSPTTVAGMMPTFVGALFLP
ncbi:MAG TPA: lactonase family protein [Polyangiaceae bacterium]